MAARNKRLQNGKLRPAARRYRAKRNKQRRDAWLANFRPGDRERFFKHADASRGVWLAGFSRETSLARAEAAEVLERVADDRGWMKLRTIDRTVVGIAPPRGRDTSPSALAKMTVKELEDSVAAFCDEDAEPTNRETGGTE